jgi:hypothetical protein
MRKGIKFCKILHPICKALNYLPQPALYFNNLRIQNHTGLWGHVANCSQNQYCHHFVRYCKAQKHTQTVLGMQECASQNLFAEAKYFNRFLPFCCRPSSNIYPLLSRNSNRISFYFPFTKLLTEVFDEHFILITDSCVCGRN